MNELVSTIIPVFNRPEPLKEAVQSVLRQTYRPVEVIVIDDGSTDETGDVADALARHSPAEVTVIHQRNSGPGLAREAGRLIARGEYIQYLDSDDVLLPWKFELQVAGLQANAGCGVSYGKTRHSATGDQPWKRTGESIKTMFPSFLGWRWWGTSTPLYRRQVVERAGPWTGLWQEEDWEYDCRIASQGIRLNNCNEFVSEQRILDADRLSSGGLGETERLLNRAIAHGLIFDHAQRAGIGPDVPEMQHFAREVFLLTRQCGAAGLSREAEGLFRIARAASDDQRRDGWDFRLYARLVKLLGWEWAARVVCFTERMRPAE